MIHLIHLLNKEELTCEEMAVVISNYLFDIHATEDIYTYQDVVEKYPKITYMAALCLEAKSYYFSSGIVENEHPIEATYKFTDRHIYFDFYGDAYYFEKGMFYEIAIGSSEDKDYQIKTIKDFRDD